MSPASHRKAALNNDDDDEKRAAHDLLQEGVERCIEVEDVEERADEENADQRPDNAADPACQLRAAKGDDRDRVELEAEVKSRSGVHRSLWLAIERSPGDLL
jgi:hypothetical protein